MYGYLRNGITNKIIQTQQLYISNLYKKNMTMFSVMIEDIQEIDTTDNNDKDKLKSPIRTTDNNVSQYKYLQNDTVKNIIKLQEQHIPKWYQDIIK